MSSESPAVLLVDRLIASFGKADAHRILDASLDQLSNVELAGLAYDWSGFWARPKQLPVEGEWRSWGMLQARGTGKTTAFSFYIVGEVMAGRAMSIGLAAQNEERTIAIQVLSLVEASPPWFKPEWRASARTLVWPNGACAYAFTPEAPDPIAGSNFDLIWLSELGRWPASTMENAYANFLYANRLGYARFLWDSNPRRGHPILKRLLASSVASPSEHAVVRATMYENARNLGKGVIANLEREYGGTQKGREELMGEMLEDSEGSLIRSEWIAKARRHMPDRIVRCVIGVDPAITVRAGNDETGIVCVGLGVDGQSYVIADQSGKYKAAEWAGIVLKMYQEEQCDCLAVERNAGGDMVAEVLRAHADKKGLSVVVLGKDGISRHVPGTVYVKEVHARGSKEDRAQPLATAYERGRVSHVIGVDLEELEDTITTWAPGPNSRSPDRLDALVHAVTELLGLASNRPDPSQGFKGLDEVNRAIQQPTRQTAHSISSLGRGGHDPGGRI